MFIGKFRYYRLSIDVNLQIILFFISLLDESLESWIPRRQSHPQDPQTARSQVHLPSSRQAYEQELNKKT